METIKKFLNPGKEHEDQVLYGSGEDPLLTGTQPSQTHGQDSQLGGKDITENNPRSSATNPAISSDYDTTEGRHLGTGGPSTSAGKVDQSLSSGPRGVTDDTSTTASILSGVPGKDQSSSLTRSSGTNDPLDLNKPLPREPTGAGLTNPDSSSTGPYTSTHAERVDPYASSDRDRSRGIGPDSTAGSGLTGNTLPDRTVGSSGYDTQPPPTDSSFGRDAALGAGVGAGVGAGTAAALHHKRDEDDLRSASGRSYPPADHADTSAARTGPSGITTSTSAGPHSSTLANKADPRVDSDLGGYGTAGPHSSSLANKADPRVDSDLDASGIAGTHSSSLGNKANPRVDNELDRSGTTGPHSSSLANKADPRVDSDLDGSRTVGSTGYSAGTGSTAGPHSSSLGNKADPRVDSDLDRSGTAGPHSSSLANKADPRVDSDLDGSSTVGSTGYSAGTGSTAGPHSSSLGNKADPRVDSDLDGSRTVGSKGYSSGTGSTAGAIPPSVSGRDAQTGTGSAVGTLPISQTSTAGQGPESWKHEHASHGHAFAGDPCHDGNADGHPLFTKGPHITDTANLLDPNVPLDGGLPSESTAISPDRDTGLHAQRGDYHGGAAPALGSKTYGDDQQGREVPELGSTTHTSSHQSREAAASEPISQGDHHHGRDAALAGGLGAAGATAAYSSTRDDAPPTEQTSSTTGPHQSKLLNKLDPRVHASSTGSERPTSTAETSALIGSSDPGSTSHMPTSKEVGASHHHGRDVGVGVGTAGATGLAGAAVYEHEKHSKNLESSGPSTSTTGVGSTGVGPTGVGSTGVGSTGVGSTGVGSTGVGSTGAGSTGAGSTGAGSTGVGSTGVGSTGVGSTGVGSAGVGSTGVGSAGVGSAGVGSTGVGSTGVGSTGVGSTGTVGANNQEVYGDNVTSAVDRGLGISEKERYPREDKDLDRTSRLPDVPGGHYPKSQEPTYSKGGETTAPSTTKDAAGIEPESDSGHHYLRDAGLASAGIGGGLAAYEVQKVHARDEPVTASTEPSTYPPPGPETGGRIADTYTGRDSAAAPGAAGTGLGTDDGAEFSKREAEKLAEAREKESQKELKAIHKEEGKHEKALEKEEKQHEKEERKHEKALAKEEKKHEKEERKQEKALEKEEKKLQKEEKKHEKELAKEEKEGQDDGKKHGGILGLLHRDKSDKVDETDVHDEYPERSYREAEVAGAPAAGDSTRDGTGVGTGVDTGVGTGVGTGVESEKHKPNKLHKDPPAGYYESKGYYPPTTGDGSQPSDGNEYSSSHQRSTTGDVYPKVPGGTIIDPQTGLPVEVEKGSGHGGTDSGTVPGYHSRETDASGLDRSRDINQL